MLTIPDTGIDDADRLGIQPGFIDSANLIMSIAMRALTFTYLLTHPRLGPLGGTVMTAALWFEARLSVIMVLMRSAAALALADYAVQADRG